MTVVKYFSLLFIFIYYASGAQTSIESNVKYIYRQFSKISLTVHTKPERINLGKEWPDVPKPEYYEKNNLIIQSGGHIQKHKKRCISCFRFRKNQKIMIFPFQNRQNKTQQV